MDTWRMRRWPASQVRVEKLEWLGRLSVMTAISPVGCGLDRVIDQWRLDPVAIGRPARWRREGAEDDRTQLVSADHGRLLGWGGVEGGNRRPLGAKSGSAQVLHDRTGSQRTLGHQDPADLAAPDRRSRWAP
jgi:hypothetical protein